jgi:hypothetical protein
MTFRFPRRLTPLVAVAVLALGVAACSDDKDPVAPGLGIAETRFDSGFLTPAVPINSFGFVANRTARIYVRVCGETSSNVDAAAITNSRTVDGVRIADTLSRASAGGVGACETVNVDAIAGNTYRIVVNPVGGFGRWRGCYSYTESDCSATVAFDYYAAIADEMRDQPLIGALSAAVAAGQRTFQYDSARGWLYQSVDDPDSNNVITDVYVGRSANIVRRVLDGLDNDATDANFNAEHIWPQSCGANVEVSTAAPNGARGDLHNLLSSDGPANSARSNNPFGPVTGTPTFTTTPPTGITEVSRRGPGAGGVVFFEPRASRRGDIARAIFYFYVRYAATNPDSVSLANFNREEATLRQWAAADPVDDFERARNDVVYLVQRNRNPFIDDPGLLARIADFPDVLPGARATCNF